MSQSPEAARPGASFGAMLRHAREERGISHDDVARDTRIAKRYVIALDNESIGTLPGGPYNRAYVRAYAAYVGLDADRIVRDYDRTVQEHSQTSLSAAQPDQIAALRAVIQQKESQTSGRKISPATSKGLLIASSIAGVVLAAGVWVGARRLSDAAEVPHAQLSTAAIGVSDAIAKSGQRANTGPAKFSTLEKEIHAPAAAEAYVESEPRVAEAQQEPRQIGATPVPTVLKKSGEIAITEDLVPATSISVNDSGVGTDIVNRALVGRSETFAAGTRVVFWTLVNGGHRGDTVRHVWFHRGRSVATVRLPVASASWRTHSQRVLGPGTDGEWAVEAQDEHGRVLARHAFRSGT
jgi:cytoskeletal protein RodZ